MMNYHKLEEMMIKRFNNNEKDQLRLRHSLYVVKMALELNKHHNLGLDEEVVKVTALLHDYAKVFDVDTQFKLLAKYFTSEQLNYYLEYPSLIHAFLGAYLVKEELNIQNEEIFEAIYYHTTGKKNMSLLTKLIYASDGLEESRTYPGVEDLRKKVFEDFDKGIYLLIKATIDHLNEVNKSIEKNTYDAYLYYEEENTEISK